MGISFQHFDLNWQGLPPQPSLDQLRGRVVIIGNFDGLHLGHQELLKQALHLAQLDQTSCSVLSFLPHPSFVLRPEQTSQAILTSYHYHSLLEIYGMQQALSLEFNEELARRSGEQFVTWIHEKLKPRKLVVGFNFAFGRGKACTAQNLFELGQAHGISVVIVPEVKDASGLCISSTRIRAAISKGELTVVSQLLGREYSIKSVVLKGAQRGAALGFPTANFDLGLLLTPPEGVYASSALFDGKEYSAVSHLGRAETFNSQDKKLETHLLNFSGDLYGKVVDVIFKEKLRDNVKFNDVSKLKLAISTDIQKRRSL